MPSEIGLFDEANGVVEATIGDILQAEVVTKLEEILSPPRKSLSASPYHMGLGKLHHSALVQSVKQHQVQAL